MLASARKWNHIKVENKSPRIKNVKQFVICPAQLSVNFAKEHHLVLAKPE